MDRIRDFLARQRAAADAKKAAWRAHLDSIGRGRRIADFVIICAMFAVIVVGFAAKANLTAACVAVILLYLKIAIVRYPGWRRGLGIGLAFSPVVILPLGMIVGGLTMDHDYQDMLRRQDVLIAHSDDLQQDSIEFLGDYRAGDVETVGAFGPDPLLQQSSSNDWAAYWVVKRLSRLMYLFAPDRLNTEAILPLAEVLYADRAIILHDEKMVEKYGLSGKPEQDAQSGVLREIGTPEDEREYFGLFMVTCHVKDDGEVLMVTGMPAGVIADLTHMPGAGPLIETCRDVALQEAQQDVMP